MTALAGSIVVLVALWLLGLAVLSFLAPDRAAGFLWKFASSARAHYLEQTLRLIAGAALVVFAPRMRFPDVFDAFGWIVAGTAVALLLTPWRWHHRFAQRVVPFAVRHLTLFGFGALALGGLILWAIVAA